MKRDPKGSMLYWNTWIDFHERNVDKMLAQASEPFPNKEYLPQFFFEIAKNISDLMLYRYSRGDDINLIGRRFDTLLDSWEKSVGLGNDIWDEDTKRTRTSWDVNIDFYSYCLRLVGLSLLLDFPAPKWQRLISLVGNEGRMKFLIELLLIDLRGELSDLEFAFRKHIVRSWR